MSTAVVETKGLQKSYGAKKVLNDVALCVPRGVGFGLIGPNGAGKTTLIKLLLGLAHPSQGEIRVLGEPPGSIKALQRIGYLPEQYAIPSHLTPVNYLASLGRLRRLERGHTRARAELLLDRMGLARSVWEKPVGKYSKGMRQRLGLCGVLLAEPQLLILDEPTDGLDPIGRAEIRDILIDEIARGTTVFLNSHLLVDTERMCRDVGLLHEGRLAYCGPVQDVSRQRGFRVRVRKGEKIEARALACGFLLGVSPSPDALELRFPSEVAEDFTVALQRLLSEGAVLLEAGMEKDDLEAFFKAQVGQQARG